MAQAAVGARAQMAFDTALPFDTSSIPVEFISEDLRKREEILDTNGIRGTRSHARERTRSGRNVINGTIRLHASPVLLDNLLPHILGGSESIDVFAVAETIPDFQIMIDRQTKVFTYTDCRVSRAIFRGSMQSGQFLELDLEVEAGGETVGNSGTFPSLTMPTDPPWIFSDAVITALSTTRCPFDFEITIDNVLDPNRFVNAVNRKSLPALDRIVSVRMTTPYSTDEEDLYQQALAGAAFSAVFTNADQNTEVLTISCGTVQFPDISPAAGGKVEIPLELDGIARSVGSTKEIEITNVNSFD